MSTLDELKVQVDTLTPEQQLELAHYATSKGTAAKQSAEELELFQSLPTPVTDNDRAFIEKNKNNKNIQRDKIKFTTNSIELDGLKFPRTIVKYDDIKDIEWLELDNNVYQKDGNDYFTFDAVQQLGKAGKSIPSKDQRQQAADVFGWSYGLLGQLLNYPKVGVRRFSSRSGVAAVSHLWSFTSYDSNHWYYIWFISDGGFLQDWFNKDSRSLIFLQD